DRVQLAWAGPAGAGAGDRVRLQRRVRDHDDAGCPRGPRHPARGRALLGARPQDPAAMTVSPTLERTLNEPAAAPAPPVPGYWVGSLHPLFDNRVGFTCGVLLLLMGLIAVLAPVISHYLTHSGPYDQ